MLVLAQWEDVGAATDPDGASIHWNPAKMAYVPNKMGFAVSYTPWLRALVPDINLAYISGYGKIGKKGHANSIRGRCGTFHLDPSPLQMLRVAQSEILHQMNLHLM